MNQFDEIAKSYGVTFYENGHVETIPIDTRPDIFKLLLLHYTMVDEISDNFNFLLDRLCMLIEKKVDGEQIIGFLKDLSTELKKGQKPKERSVKSTIMNNSKNLDKTV